MASSDDANHNEINKENDILVDDHYTHAYESPNKLKKGIVKVIDPRAHVVQEYAPIEQSIISIMKPSQVFNEAIYEDTATASDQTMVSIEKSNLGDTHHIDPQDAAEEQSIKSTNLSQGLESMIDCLGRSITKDCALGGLRTSFFILGVIVCGYFTFGGVFFNLVLYLRRVWKQGSARAANNATNLVGTIYCTCIFGAFLGDTYLGRILAVAIFLTIYTVGCGVSAVWVTLKERNGSASETFLIMALYVMCMGCGSYQPVIVSLGGDQFNTATQKARFFSWVFVASNIGVMLSLTLLTYLENMGRWALGFWIATTSVGISIPLFLIGVPFMRQTKLGGNPLLSMLQVLVSATRNYRIKFNKDVQLFEANQKKFTINGNPKRNLTKSLRWLDRAAMMNEKYMDSNGLSSPWRVCTLTQVEEVKCVVRIIPIILFGIAYNVANAQLVSLFIVQGDTMENQLWGFKIPPGSMRLFTNLSGIIFPPFYEYVLVPRIRARTHHEKGLTPLQRMGWGLVFGAKAMAIAAFLERKRLHSSFKISILWLIPQFTIMGISNSLFIVSQMDFFYSEIPQCMKSLGSSLFLLCMGLGNYGSSLLVTTVNHFSSLYHAKWIPYHINDGHLDYFFWLLVGILLATLLMFLIYSSSYKKIQVEPQALGTTIKNSHILNHLSPKSLPSSHQGSP